MTDRRPRARELGIRIGLLPTGRNNAITDVEGVRVGHTTLVHGHGPLRRGEGPVRTGVTVVVPPGDERDAVYAGTHTLNGNGEMTGLEWIRHSGMLTTPIGLTNTHSVGVVRDAIVAAGARNRPEQELYWALPVVAETWDGLLNDINGQHVRREHLFAALDAAAGGPVAEGNVGGGTGMVCHEFKGGIGTASRIIDPGAGGYVVGALVQANHGRRERLTVAGKPVGQLIPRTEVPSPYARLRPPPEAGSGSIIVILATDAPLLPHQCRALAERAGLGVARVGGAGERSSGDIFLCFATGNQLTNPEAETQVRHVRTVADRALSELFWAAVEATEEAIVNALVAAETMQGCNDVVAHALPADALTALADGA
ncbi:MAG TPA: P1 family peptidase [Candidatus Limnocylindrales bacterium]|nr:P1 family peptidase [Candidatus Limnocylindrales bacterium]